MPIYEDKDHTREDLEELRKWNVCAVCGTFLNLFLDIETNKVYLACNDWLRTHHEGIVREASQYQKEGLEAMPIPERRKLMEETHGVETMKALEKYQAVTSLTRPQSMEILARVYPDAPDAERIRAAILCASYSLNPLMGHVFLIKFKKWKDGKVVGEEWATVIGIKAKRLLSSRRGGIQYRDDTPRLMTEEEQLRVFGEVDHKHLVALTKLRDAESGAEAVGYGKWLLEATVFGVDKGNSAANMAFIRSESQALDRLRPGEMPAGVEVIDERFAGGEVVEGEVIEGEAKEIEPEKPAAKKLAKAKAKQPEAKEPEAEVEAPEPSAEIDSPARLFEEVMIAKSWKTTQYCRTFILNDSQFKHLNITEEMIEKEPAKVWKMIAPIIAKQAKMSM